MVKDIQHHTKMHRQYRRRAFTLTELCIVVSIMGVVTGGIWATVQKVVHQQAADEAALDIIQTMQNYLSFKSQAPGAFGSFPIPAGSDITIQAWNAGIFPKNMENPDPAYVATYPVVGPWGSGWQGRVGLNLSSTNIAGPPPAVPRYVNLINIDMGQVPPEACVQIFSQHLLELLQLGLYTTYITPVAPDFCPGPWGMNPNNYMSVGMGAGGGAGAGCGVGFTASNIVKLCEGSMTQFDLAFVYPPPFMP